MQTIVSSKRSLRDDPQYFGAFANIARHNVYKILCDISERTRMPKPANEESLFTCAVIRVLDNSTTNANWGKINRPEVCRHVIERLNEHFKFLPLLNKTLHAENPSPDKYHGMICNFLQCLDKVRNQYVHAIYTPTLLDADFIHLLELIFDAGLQDVKQRFTFAEIDLNHLRRSKGLDRKTNRPKRNPDFKYDFYEKGNITEKGVAFFICLFLEKEYSTLFLKKLQDFKAGDKKPFQATIEAYTISRCKLPENKLKSLGYDKTALLLDMLNELQRCPKELFDSLSPEDQGKFRTGTIETEQEDNPEEEENISLLIRKQNRFPYFGLRYIDHMNLFKSLRFQVDLGNYHFHSYDKQMDDQSIVRRWEKKLLSFGKLNEISERAGKEWQALIKSPTDIDDNTPTPFIIQSRAHYHIVGNNIALKDSGAPKFIELPELKTGKKERTQTQESDFYLCLDELPGLLFYSYVTRDRAKTAEDIIKSFKTRTDAFLNDFIKGKITPLELEKITNQYSARVVAKKLDQSSYEKEYDARKAELASMLIGYNLEPHQVPDTLCKYLMRIEPVNINERAEQVVQFYLDETERLLKYAGESGRKTDKKTKKQLRKQQRYLHLSAGDSALFLAKDMVYLQPPLKDESGNATPGGKANPDEFQLLQSRLAFFGGEKQNLERTFRLTRLIDSTNPHPFLNKIDWKRCKESLDFYKSYLHQRKRFFEFLLKEKSYANYYFLTRNNKTTDKEYFINLAKEIGTKPVNLPRGLFKDALIEYLSQKGDPASKELMGGENSKHNIVFLINEWFARKCDDSYQPFYNWKRNYRIVDEIFDKRPKTSFQPIKKLYKTPEELTQLSHYVKDKKEKRKTADNREILIYNIYKKKVIENEKLIRHYRTSDQMLFLMCKEMLTQEADKIKDAFRKDFYLKDINPENERSILESRVTISVPVQAGNKQVKYIEENVKIKDYGKLRKYLKDKRLSELLDYYDIESIPLSVLKRQLLNYERYRLPLFDTIYQFEKACASASEFKEIIDNNLKLNDYVSHGAFLKHCKDLKLISESEWELLKIIRNAFSHNQFPAKQYSTDHVSNHEQIMEELTMKCLNLYNRCIDKLNTKDHDL